MKGSGRLVASVLAASTFALNSSSSSSSNGDRNLASCYSSGQDFYSSSGKSGTSASSPAIKKDQFEPRFDGLRFIETLVTAHK